MAENETSAAAEIDRMLDALLPGDTVEVHDIEGGAYTLRTTIPAARQWRAFKALDALLKREATLALAEGMQRSGSPASLLVQGIEALGDEAFVQELARVAVEAYGDLLGPQPLEERFAIEELLAAILPFVARPLLRAIRAARPAMRVAGLGS